ncbi:MAG: patatin-like phospholipase family protein [Alphaproteobacteria bacterium]
MSADTSAAVPRDFRILSLDGGGVWALIQIEALIALNERGEAARGRDVLREFDFVAANSGGAITLGCLLADFTLAQCRAFFASEPARRSIFQRTSFVETPISHVLRHILRQKVGPQYRTAAKLAGLKAFLGAAAELPLARLPLEIGRNVRGRDVHILVCAFDYDTSRAVFCRSDSLSRSGSGGQAQAFSLAEAIHASSTAPVNFFNAPTRGPGDRRFWDGAVGGYNNPVLAAIVEVLANADRYGTARAHIKALSIGTGSEALPRRADAPTADERLVAMPENAWLFNDLKKVATSILGDPPDAASYIAHVALGGRLPDGEAVTEGPIVRMNPLIQPRRLDDGTWDFPEGMSPEQFGNLRKLELDAVSDKDVKLIAHLCDRWIAGSIANQPIRADRKTWKPQIGHATFKEAKHAWEHIQRRTTAVI